MKDDFEITISVPGKTPTILICSEKGKAKPVGLLHYFLATMIHMEILTPVEVLDAVVETYADVLEEATQDVIGTESPSKLVN